MAIHHQRCEAVDDGPECKHDRVGLEMSSVDQNAGGLNHGSEYAVGCRGEIGMPSPGSLRRADFRPIPLLIFKGMPGRTSGAV